MSFFNKMLASVGIGAAEIDTHLEKTSYHPGEEIRGMVHIKGGNVEQKVDNIYIKVMTEYIREHDDKKVSESYAVAKFHVADSMTVRKGETLQIPFSFPLPLETPLTLSRQPVWIHTGLDIDNALDPNDRDFIEVTPHPFASIVLKAAQDLGFRFKGATCEYHPRLGRGTPFVQEIEFYPSPEFASRVKELEFIFSLEHNGIHVLVEVDRRGRGLSGWLEQSFDMDERQAWLSLSQSDLQRGTGYVADVLEDLILRQAR
ncbi:sporulation protein [Paenibacillus sp. P96]|uniref:Sporulation protein n=1 Tax=Paenibacillus zeirhizosphaerae TaxID=2987519 RepID=A0ABT9FPT2_9BACL|nr:sporulation protein [Paenibacillus sp. P96]MDP4096724.1 sporulation protein [Paenibacillus sp. P96]